MITLNPIAHGFSVRNVANESSIVSSRGSRKCTSNPSTTRIGTARRMREMQGTRFVAFRFGYGHRTTLMLRSCLIGLVKTPISVLENCGGSDPVRTASPPPARLLCSR